MDSHKTTTKSTANNKSHAGTTTSSLLRHGKKLANALYEDGMTKLNSKVHATEDELKEYSDQVLKKVQQNPLSSILIAGGVGFLLSLLLKK